MKCAFKTAEHEGGKATAQDDGGDNDGLPGGQEGSTQGPDGASALLQQNAVLGQEVKGVIHCDAKSDGEDDGGRYLQVDVHGPHEAGDKEQGEDIGHQGDQGHFKALEQKPHDECHGCKCNQQTEHHVRSEEPVV